MQRDVQADGTRGDSLVQTTRVSSHPTESKAIPSANSSHQLILRTILPSINLLNSGSARYNRLTQADAVVSLYAYSSAPVFHAVHSLGCSMKCPGGAHGFHLGWPVHLPIRRGALGISTSADPATYRAAFEAFARTRSLAEMRGVVSMFPAILNANFVADIQRILASDLTVATQPELEYRVHWLQEVLSPTTPRASEAGSVRPSQEPKSGRLQKVMQAITEEMQPALTAFQTVQSLPEMRTAVTHFPQMIATGTFERLVIQLLPQVSLGERSEWEQRLEWLREVAAETPKRGPNLDDLFDSMLKAFVEANSLDAMVQAVIRFPLMLDAPFAFVFEDVIRPQATPDVRALLDVRLEWLRHLKSL